VSGVVSVDGAISRASAGFWLLAADVSSVIKPLLANQRLQMTGWQAVETATANQSGWKTERGYALQLP
jgi:hypothetical protein